MELQVSVLWYKRPLKMLSFICFSFCNFAYKMMCNTVICRPTQLNSTQLVDRVKLTGAFRFASLGRIQLTVWRHEAYVLDFSVCLRSMSLVTVATQHTVHVTCMLQVAVSAIIESGHSVVHESQTVVTLVLQAIDISIRSDGSMETSLHRWVTWAVLHFVIQ